MKNDNLTSASQELLNNAVKIATTNENSNLEPVHTLAAGLNSQFCLSFFQSFDIPLHTLTELVETELARLPQAYGSELVAGHEMQEFLRQLQAEAKRLGDSYVSLEHFFIVWSTTQYLSPGIRAFFKQYKFDKKTILEKMKGMRKGKGATEKGAEGKYEVLEKFTQNLTKLARDGKLDPVIGRDEEIRRVIQILSRRTKNNPVLIGDPGVGKTAIVEGIAQRIINDDIPEGLRGSDILSLDMGLLIAGTKYQGEFEERLKNLLKAIEESPKPIILFIDEMHMLVGAGQTGGGGMDASNLLKPALARGVLHAIGATTLNEYKKYIEKDAALERRFQKVIVPEPSVEDAISILRGLKEKYELHHGIKIKDQALVNAVKLSSKNIPDRFLPDKAIDLMDEAASMVKMAIDSKPEELDKLERKINQLEIEKVALTKEKDDPQSATRLKVLEKELADIKDDHKILFSAWESERKPLETIKEIKEKIEEANYQYQLAEREGDFAKASEIKYGKLVKLEDELVKEQEKIKALSGQLIKQVVDEGDIAAVLSRWTKIPVEKLKESEKAKLLNMDKILEERVVGQREAIEQVTHAIQAHRAGLTDPNRPIGSFLFLGPTGVGKTEVAKTLADYLFNDPNRMVRIDMSEFMEKHAVSRLIGSPPGYVGYEEGGRLTEEVRRNPFSVVLFDEMEKAHPDVYNILLQILDEGHLTDGQGKRVSFKNTIIIMTSNIGSKIILDAKKLDQKVKDEVQKILQNTFRPEFLNRIDSIVFFNKLGEKEVQEIAKNHLKELEKRMEEKGITLTIAAPVVKELAEIGFDPEFGARPLKRAIQQRLITPLAQYILAKPEAKKIEVSLDKDKKVQIK
jgi:ATP-dependent Clp protease ATP-binding subunit ClpB